jgi:hypothetical protein
MTEEKINNALHCHNIHEGQLFTAAEVFTPEERQAHLIEFTYTGDKWMAIKYHQQKLQQHTTYLTRMQEAGWQVRLTVIVVSHSDVTTSTLQVCFKDLGVPQRHIDTVIATLAHNALRYARSIRRTRALLYTRTQQHTQYNTHQDTTPAGDIQQRSSTLPHPLHQRRIKRTRTIYDPG